MSSRRLVSIIACAICATVLAESDVPLNIEQAWVRAAPPGAMVLAGYMTLRNSSQDEISIVKVTSPEFAMIEMHRTVVQNGLARMLAQDELVVPPGGTLTLRPGGLHLMMMQPKRPLKAGDVVSLSMHIAGQQTITVKAPVKR